MSSQTTEGSDVVDDELVHPAMEIQCYDAPHTLNGLAEKLNRILYGMKVVRWEIDTADGYPSLNGSYLTMTTRVSAYCDPGDAQNSYLSIPVGLGIRLWNRLIQAEGDFHATRIGIVGDHISIAQPYIFGETGLKWHHYGLSALGSIDE
ncbi:MAG: hypothetical protein ABIR91_02015 [Candidatus Saccharimonadales bacterium]